MYLGMNQEDDIKDKKRKLLKEVKILDKSLTELKTIKKDKTKVKGVVGEVLDNLKGIYTKRREAQGDNIGADEIWITSEKNLHRCKLLGKEPLVVLADLRKWYLAQEH